MVFEDSVACTPWEMVEKYVDDREACSCDALANECVTIKPFQFVEFSMVAYPAHDGKQPSRLSLMVRRFRRWLKRRLGA